MSTLLQDLNPWLTQIWSLQTHKVFNLFQSPFRRLQRTIQPQEEARGARFNICCLVQLVLFRINTLLGSRHPQVAPIWAQVTTPQAWADPSQSHLIAPTNHLPRTPTCFPTLQVKCSPPKAWAPDSPSLTPLKPLNTNLCLNLSSSTLRFPNNLHPSTLLQSSNSLVNSSLQVSRRRQPNLHLQKHLGRRGKR